jgi:TPR repeat protein
MRASFGEGAVCNGLQAAAVEWWRKAADQGHADAQYLIGLCYHEKGTTIDKVSSVEWFSKAADQGHAKAQHSLGCAYYYGYGVPVDRAAAAEWFREAVLTQQSEATPTHRIP